MRDNCLNINFWINLKDNWHTVVHEIYPQSKYYSSNLLRCFLKVNSSAYKFLSLEVGNLNKHVNIIQRLVKIDVFHIFSPKGMLICCILPISLLMLTVYKYTSKETLKLRNTRYYCLLKQILKILIFITNQKNVLLQTRAAFLFSFF